MSRETRWGAVLALALLAPAVANAFDADEVYWAPSACGGTCGLFDVTAGGDMTGATPFATIGNAPGQLAWRTNPTGGFLGYLTQFSLDSVIRITPGGAVTTWSTGIDGATGLLIDSSDRMLVVSFNDGEVYDVTGGVPAGAPFAWGLDAPRNLLELATGEILVADQFLLTRAVLDISAGGDFSGVTPCGPSEPACFAYGFTSDGPFDLVQNASGRIFASTDGFVYDITAGGDFSSAPSTATGVTHATGRSFVGLTIDGAGRLLATELDSGSVFDITLQNDYGSAIPFASNLDGSGDTALDTVPTATPPPALVPSLGGVGGALLAGLLALGGAVGLRGARRGRRVSASGTSAGRGAPTSAQ